MPLSTSPPQVRRKGKGPVDDVAWRAASVKAQRQLLAESRRWPGDRKVFDQAFAE